MKVLILNPPVLETTLGREGRCTATTPVQLNIFPPLTALFSAALLKKENFNVKIFDGVVSHGDMKDVIESHHDIVFINLAASSFQEDIKLAKWIKSKYSCHLSCFGYFPTMKSDLLLDTFDSVVRGETEMSLFELCKALRDDKPLKNVNGISYRSHDKSFHNPQRELFDLAELPLPARDLIDNKLYTFPFTGEPYASILAGRGCPQNCVFCTAHILFGKRLRLRPIENIVEEIKDIKRRGIKIIAFIADDFMGNRDWVLKLCEIIKPLKIKWMCNSRVNDVDQELLYKIYDAGCRYIFFGVESGSQYVLDKAKKNIKLDQIENAIKMAKKAKLRIETYFIIGLPYETTETVRQTINFAKKLDPDYAGFSAATPYPGTEFYDYVKANNLIENEDKFNTSEAVVRTKDMSSEDINKWINRAFREFYFRPSVITREIVRVFTNGEWRKIKIGLQLLKWAYYSNRI
jgi:radical SAM superfamily enzyme YgiQ (UPF0313 family)